VIHEEKGKVPTHTVTTFPFEISFRGP